MSTDLLEDNYKDLLRGQQSIGKLFPQFQQRVRGVENAGGIRMTSMQPDRWTFKVASSSGNGSYELVVNFKDFDSVIKKHVKNLKIWNKDRTSVDLRKLAYLCMLDVQVQLMCSCPAQKYFGFNYILTKKDAKYTEPEVRRPDTRNPNQYGRYCKHLAVLMNRLPLYTATMANFIGKYHSKTVDAAVNGFKVDRERVKRMKDFLQKKEQEKLADKAEQEKADAGSDRGDSTEESPRETEK